MSGYVTLVLLYGILVALLYKPFKVYMSRYKYGQHKGKAILKADSHMRCIDIATGLQVERV